MQMPGRNGSTGDYRYGFQGQERDDEISGGENSYSSEYWQYDPRLGRRWNIDPVDKDHESPYAAFANNPLWFIDPSGADTSLARNGPGNLMVIFDYKDGGTENWDYETMLEGNENYDIIQINSNSISNGIDLIEEYASRYRIKNAAFFTHGNSNFLAYGNFSSISGVELGQRRESGDFSDSDQEFLNLMSAIAKNIDGQGCYVMTACLAGNMPPLGGSKPKVGLELGKIWFGEDDLNFQLYLNSDKTAYETYNSGDKKGMHFISFNEPLNTNSQYDDGWVLIGKTSSGEIIQQQLDFRLQLNSTGAPVSYRKKPTPTPITTPFPVNFMWWIFNN